MRSVERYLELLSGNTVATTASAPSSFWILSAPTKLAPDEIPTAIPSVAACFCAIRIASPSFTAITGSSWSSRTISGMNSSEIPWMRCRPAWRPVESVGDSAGSRGWMRTPVPTPATNASGGRPHSRSYIQISGPVVASCASTFAAFANCRGRNTCACVAAYASAMRIPPTKPPCARHGHDRRSHGADQVHALAAHPVGHEDGDGVAERTPHAGERDAGVPARGLGDRVPGLDPALGIGATEDVQRHPVLDAAGEVEVLGLGVDQAPLALVGELDLEHGGVADQARERAQAVLDPGAAGGRHGRSGRGAPRGGGGRGLPGFHPNAPPHGRAQL